MIQGKYIDYIDSVVETIKREIKEVLSNDYDYYNNYKVEIASEQFYNKNKNKLTDNTIYIVVKFGQAVIDFGMVLQPFQLLAVSEVNKVDTCQKLLSELSQRYNLYRDNILVVERINEDDSISMTQKEVPCQQTYNSPVGISTFQELWAGFRGVYTVSGNFLISPNIIRSELFYVNDNNEEEKVDLLSFGWDFNLAIDGQPVFDNENRTRAIAKYGTFMIDFTSFLNKSDFTLKILKMVARKENVKTKFTFIIKWEDEEVEPYKSEFTLQHVKSTENKGENPVIGFTFIE